MFWLWVSWVIGGPFPLCVTYGAENGGKKEDLLFRGCVWLNRESEVGETMKKILMALLCMLFLLTGCAGAGHGQKDITIQGEITFTDDLGRNVTMDRPERVAALTGSFADLWCLAGGEETLSAAAHDAWTSFDLGLSEAVTDLGTIKQPDLERLLAAQPDLVLASSNTAAQAQLLPLLEQAGVTVAYFNVTNFSEYLNMLSICTQLTGQEDRYARYGQALEDQIAAARGRADGSQPTVLYIRATGSGCKVKNSRDTVLGEMLADLDCRNIADREDSLLEELSLEVILQSDPDYIFAVCQGADPTDARRMLDQTLLSNPAWQSLTAVREGRFHVLEHELYNLKPNARWGEAYENLANILYPDR